MKSASCSPSGLLSIAICAVLGASAAQAADKPAINETQLPRQVLSTGEEDVAQIAPAARAAAAVAVSESQLLEADLVEMTSESDEGLVVEQLSDGSSMVDLQGRFMNVLVATPTEDGGTTVSCHTGHDAVAHAAHAKDVASGKAPKDAPPRQVQQPVAPQALEEK
jgi:hypothetical protein